MKSAEQDTQKDPNLIPVLSIRGLRLGRKSRNTYNGILTGVFMEDFYFHRCAFLDHQTLLNKPSRKQPMFLNV